MQAEFQDIELQVLNGICPRLPVMFMPCGLPPPTQLLFHIDLNVPGLSEGLPFLMCSRQRPEDVAQDFARVHLGAGQSVRRGRNIWPALMNVSTIICSERRVF